jgi:hypothetical protein
MLVIMPSIVHEHVAPLNRCTLQGRLAGTREACVLDLGGRGGVINGGIVIGEVAMATSKDFNHSFVGCLGIALVRGSGEDMVK